jgi:hypothetical protein
MPSHSILRTTLREEGLITHALLPTCRRNDMPFHVRQFRVYFELTDVAT